MKKTDRQLLQDAVDAIEAVLCTECAEPWGLIEEIRARLAEPEDEPVLWIRPNGIHLSHTKIEGYLPLYRHPRQPVRLSDDEIQECFDIAQKNFSKHQTGIKGQQLTIRDWPNWHFAKAIEQAIMEKNK